MPRNEQLLLTSTVLLEVLSELVLDQQKRCHLSWGWNHCGVVRNLELFPIPTLLPTASLPSSPTIVIFRAQGSPGRQIAREPGKRNSFRQYIVEHSKGDRAKWKRTGSNTLMTMQKSEDSRMIKKKLIGEGPLGRGEKISAET